MIVLVPIRLAGKPSCRTSFSACIRMLCGFTPSSFATSSTDISSMIHQFVNGHIQDSWHLPNLIHHRRDFAPPLQSSIRKSAPTLNLADAHTLFFSNPLDFFVQITTTHLDLLRQMCYDAYRFICCVLHRIHTSVCCRVLLYTDVSTFARLKSTLLCKQIVNERSNLCSCIKTSHGYAEKKESALQNLREKWA